MSVTYRYENVAVAVGGATVRQCDGLVALMSQIGFSHVSAYDRVPMIRHSLAETPVDLLVVDTALPEGNICKLVQDMRHMLLGNNPFVVVLALISNPSADEVRRVIDSGVDDLLIKPINADALTARIRQLTETRRPFIVTHDYIGPDRRKQARTGEASATLLQVPNPLRSKSLRQMDPEVFDRLIQEAAQNINLRKIDCHGTQLSFLISRLEFRAQQGGSREELMLELDRLQATCSDLGRRVRGTSQSVLLPQVVSLLEIIKRMREQLPVIDTTDLGLLNKLAEHMRRAMPGVPPLAAAV